MSALLVAAAQHFVSGPTIERCYSAAVAERLSALEDPRATVDSCAWCGAELSTAAGSQTMMVRCERCHVGTTWPSPTDQELEAAYNDWYRPTTGRFKGPGDRILRWTRGSLARRIDRASPPGPILDVGAGDGTLVRALRHRGRNATGLERYGDSSFVRDADITDVGGRWAAIVFWHSLEHLRRPGEALEAAADLLLPGGLLVVAVPNALSLQAKLFGHRWFALDLPRHLFHLNPQALTQRLGELGLVVRRVSFIRGGQVFFGWLHGLVGLLPSHPDLYAAIRRPTAREDQLSRRQQIVALAAAFPAAPFAMAATAVEVALRSGGSVVIEAMR